MLWCCCEHECCGNTGSFSEMFDFPYDSSTDPTPSGYSQLVGETKSSPGKLRGLTQFIEPGWERCQRVDWAIGITIAIEAQFVTMSSPSAEVNIWNGFPVQAPSGCPVADRYATAVYRQTFSGPIIECGVIEVGGGGVLTSVPATTMTTIALRIELQRNDATNYTYRCFRNGTLIHTEPIVFSHQGNVIVHRARTVAAIDWFAFSM